MWTVRAVTLLLSVVTVFGCTTVFKDDFNRPDGPLGPPNWINGHDVNPQASVLNITDHKVCSGTHGAAIYTGDVPRNSTVHVSFTFTAPTTAGFESYALGAVNLKSPTVMLNGCDGGYGGSGSCTPTIRWIDQECSASLTADTPVGPACGPQDPLKINEVYLFEATFNMPEDGPFSASFTAMDLSGNVVAKLNGVVENRPGTPQFGVVVGRDPNGPSCIDNFLIQSC